jgi:hypothetical protein
VERWESYALGVLGILFVVVSLSLQVIAFAMGSPWSAVPLTLGIVIGALLYRAGYRLLSR